jgi:hypothetical protein
MIVTQGKPSPAGDANVVLDLLDIGLNGSRAVDGNATVAKGAMRRYQRISGSGDTANGSVDRSFFNFPGDNFRNGYPLADQITAGNTQRRTVLKSYARCYHWGWTAGFVPSQYPGLTAALPFFTRGTFETTLRKLGTGAADQTCFGWQAEGNSGPWNLNGGFRNAPMVTLYSSENQGNWDSVAIRTQMSSGANPIVFLPLLRTFSATVFRRLKTVVTLGPAFSVEFFIDGILVRTVVASDLSWTSLEATNQGFNELYPTLNPTRDATANNGVEGPYGSRLRVELVS